jgi:hypothetical protein
MDKGFLFNEAEGDRREENHSAYFQQWGVNGRACFLLHVWSCYLWTYFMYGPVACSLIYSCMDLFHVQSCCMFFDLLMYGPVSYMELLHVLWFTHVWSCFMYGVVSCMELMHVVLTN